MDELTRERYPYDAADLTLERLGHRVARCEPCGKRAYPTARAAIRVLLACLAKRGGGLRYYQCPAGSGWHLTSRRVT